FPLWNSPFPFPFLPPFPIFKLLRKSRFLFMGDDLCSYDRLKKSGHTKEKSREKGEGDGKSVPEEKSEEGCGESPLTVCSNVM
ncbi:MAG: hypothetical protein IJX61_03055, partial [Ruminococcus sp.]|nr:hypothetical protein [Ruminococcus sp.]